MSKIIKTIFSCLLTILMCEFLLRQSTSILPLPILIYFNTSIKDLNPSIMKKIKEKYPQLYEFRETSNETWTLQANQINKGFDESGKAFDFQTTNEGFLTPDFPDNQVYQLITIGDSCLSARTSKPIPWILRESLKIPVYNLATPAWGPNNYLKAFEDYATHRNSKVVVVFSFENDINDAWTYNEWKASGTKLSLLKYHASRFWLASNKGIESINMSNGWLDKNSYFWNSIKFIVREFFLLPKSMADDNNMEILENKKKNFYIQLEPNKMFLKHNPSDFKLGGAQSMWVKPYFEHVIKLKKSIENSGKKMLLIWIPSRERIYVPLLQPNRKKLYVKNKSGNIDGYEQALEEFVGQNKIDFFSTVSDLSLNAQQGEQLYYAHDFHPNVLGDRVIAESSLKTIKKLIK